MAASRAVQLIFSLLIFFKGITPGDSVTCCTNGGGACTYYTVIPVVDIPLSTYIYECQNTTLFLAMANVTIYGADALNAPQTVIGWNSAAGSTSVTITPSGSGAAAGIQWRADSVGSFNTCEQFSGTTPTTANCQYVLQVSGFNAGTYLDYETLFGSGFNYQARIRLFRNAGNCVWQILSNVTIDVKDCDEYPQFDSSIATSVSIPEYSGTNNQYAGQIVNLLVTDPDVFNTVYGNVTLSIASVTRPFKGGIGVDPTPFYIQGFNFLYQNNNASVLAYDVSRCTVVSTCLAQFDSLYDNGGSAPYWSVMDIVIQAIDGGGLKNTKTIRVNITQVPQSPVFLDLPGTVTIPENTAGPLQIYPMQMTIPRIGSNTWSIQVLNVNPPVNNAGGTYISNSSTCSPSPPAPVLCSGLVLTASVISTTFNYLTNKVYNVTVWGINIPPSGSGLIPVTVTSSVIIYITQQNYQPTLVPPNDAISIVESVPTQACLYNLSSIPTDLNNDTVFFYNLMSTTAASGSVAMWYLNGTLVCYNGLFGSVGTCCSRVFRSTFGPYLLRIRIKDVYSAPAPNTFTLTVSIIKVDDPPILTTPLTVTVPETSNTFTFDVNATQPFPASGTKPLVFNVTGISTTYNNQFFYFTAQNSTINVGYGTVGAAGPGPYFFDFLTVPIIYVNISVTDGIYTVQNSVTVYVQYVNRIPVVLNLPNSTSLLETQTGYAPLWTVSTYDKESDPRTYQFVTTTGLSQTTAYFSIDFNLGVIYYVNPMFDWYVANAYTLAVLVRDIPAAPNTPKNASSMANLTVSITLVNRPPTFTNPIAGNSQPNSTIQFYENVTGQAFIYSFRATDREGDSVYYNITEMRPVWNTAFNLAWGTNQLEYNDYYSSTKPMFNNSIIPVYQIVVETKDLGHMTSATSTTTLTVSILHVDRPALWTSLPGYISIREDVSIGPTDCYTVGAIDPNYKNYPVTLTFLGISPTTGSAKFFYNTTSNVFGYVNNPGFSYGSQNSYTALFTATNTISPIVTSSIAIAIQKINTGPYSNISVYNYTVWLREDTTSGQLLWDLRVRSNQSLSISYGLQDSTPSSGSFVVSSQGLVKLLDKPQFNYQKAPSYLVRILATDTGLGTGQQAKQTTFTLTVSIIPVPKNPVITNLPNFVSIREGYPGAGTIYLAKCTDPGGNTISWTYNVLPTSGLSYFTVAANGTISTTATANFTYLIQPNFLVVAMCGNSQLTTTATLSVAIIWTTSTSTTTTTKAQTYNPTTTTVASSSSDGLTAEQIGAIVGSLGGALVLAGIAYGIARYMQSKTEKEGITAMQKNPMARVDELNLDVDY